MTNILILGKKGQVAWELRRTFATLGNVIAADREVADLTQVDELVSLIRTRRPHIIINAAAYTAVDKAENEETAAFAVNGIAPGVIAEEAKRLNALCIHYSTDYVFNGCATTPYGEEASTDPLNVYGRSKLAGEEAMHSVGGRYLIFRTSWVYGMRGKNFLLTMLRLGQEKEELKIISDQKGAPTWSRMIAEGTMKVAAQCLHQQEQPWGTYHLTASGVTSWHGFAQAIFQKKQLKDGQRIPNLLEISSEQYPSPVIRPKYSVLSNEKIGHAFGVYLPSWENSLELCLDI
jgi:dTDP-4-dehydrorhamnose reductase